MKVCEEHFRDIKSMKSCPTPEGIEMKVAVITTKAAMSRIWNHAEKASSHDMHLIPVTEFKSKVGIPRMKGWQNLTRLSPDCIWVDQHNIEGLYCRLFQIYNHEDVPVIGYLRGDIWTEVSDLSEYLMNKWKRKLRKKQKKEIEDEFSLLNLLRGKKAMEELSIAALYDASLPFILAYKFHFSFLRNLSMGRYDLLVCISRWLEERSHQEMPRTPTDVWYRGMNPAPFLSMTEPMDLLHPCVGIVQNHSIMRKTKPLLEFAPVVRALPDVHFYISEGISRWLEFLPQVKKALSAFENVHFLKVTPKNVSAFLKSIDCYALVSGLDAFPSTVREAQLAKAPVVASKVGGVEEALAKSPWNAVIENEDTESWVKTLREFVKGKGENEEGCQYVISKFRWDVAIKRFNEICSREIQRKKS
ncbi:MAG: glycosyltransferase [Theionarchaea archaeon]|nr:glycosyltransferase [Theionarchaea archaeon]